MLGEQKKESNSWDTQPCPGSSQSDGRLICRQEVREERLPQEKAQKCTIDLCEESNCRGGVGGRTRTLERFRREASMGQSTIPPANMKDDVLLVQER